MFCYPESPCGGNHYRRTSKDIAVSQAGINIIANRTCFESECFIYSVNISRSKYPNCKHCFGRVKPSLVSKY